VTGGGAAGRDGVHDRLDDVHWPPEDLMAATPAFRHKHVRIDQKKLDRARRILRAATETETLDRALGVVVAEAEIEAALRRVRARTKLEKVFS
jgi:hypothetical protein